MSHQAYGSSDLQRKSVESRQLRSLDLALRVFEHAKEIVRDNSLRGVEMGAVAVIERSLADVSADRDEMLEFWSMSLCGARSAVKQLEATQAAEAADEKSVPRPCDKGNTDLLISA